MFYCINIISCKAKQRRAGAVVALLFSINTHMQLTYLSDCTSESLLHVSQKNKKCGTVEVLV